MPQNRPPESVRGGGGGGVKESRRRETRGDKIEEKRRQNLEEAEKVATGKFGCEMKGGEREGGKESCVGEGG